MAALSVILGSDSDLPKVRDCFEIFNQFVIVSSAHRSSEKTVELGQSVSD